LTEWVDREAITFVPPTARHAQFALVVQRRRLGTVLAAPSEVRQSTNSSREPDFAFISHGIQPGAVPSRRGVPLPNSSLLGDPRWREGPGRHPVTTGIIRIPYQERTPSGSGRNASRGHPMWRPGLSPTPALGAIVWQSERSTPPRTGPST